MPSRRWRAISGLRDLLCKCRINSQWKSQQNYNFLYDFYMRRIFPNNTVKQLQINLTQQNSVHLAVPRTGLPSEIYLACIWNIFKYLQIVHYGPCTRPSGMNWLQKKIAQTIVRTIISSRKNWSVPWHWAQNLPSATKFICDHNVIVNEITVVHVTPWHHFAHVIEGISWYFFIIALVSPWYLEISPRWYPLGTSS